MKQKNNILLFTIILFSMSLNSCTQNKKETAADQQLGKLDVEIPQSLKNKPEVVTYIHDMNKITDDYALLIDQVLSDLKGFERKDMENMGMMDKIKFMKVSSEVGFKSLDMVSKWGDYQNRLDLFKEDLTEDESLALESVMNRFEERMKQIEEKHSRFFK